MADRGVRNEAKNATGAAAPTAGLFDFSAMLTIADMLPVMVCMIDPDGRYRFVNKPYADWFERSRGDILGRTMAEVIGEEAADYRAPMMAAALGGDPQFFVTDYDHPTRGMTAIQTSYIPWRGADGPEGRTVRGIVTILADITEQRVAERALKESEARFRRIANSAPALMWVTRIDRVRDFVNDAYVDFVCGPECDMKWLGSSTGAPASTPTTSTGSSPKASPARPRCRPSRSRAATVAGTANIAG